jgi:hypothetical protein
MAVKLIDLQLIYGVAGAQEKFEQLVTQLVKGEYPSATKVRTVRGDGGIDVYMGEFSDPAGIDVYQAKYFVKEIGKSQQGQIRDAFTTIQRSPNFKARSWTLCLPINMTAEETTWFEKWKSKQAGIEIRQPWDETKLESLLLATKNRDVKEEFFKEEHLTQIREMHGMMQSLVNRIEEWFREAAAEQKQAKQADVLASQAEYLDQFVRSLRDQHFKLVQQCASEAEVQSNQPARWETVISPSWIPDQPRIGSYAECWSIVQACQGGIGSWRYPEVSLAQRTSGEEWIEGTWANQRDIECWRLSPKGVFAHMFTVPDDNRYPLNSAKSFLYVNDAIGRLTEMFRFAANLAERAYDPGDGAVDVSVTLTGIQGRQLTFSDGFLRPSCCARMPEFKKAWHCPRAELLSAPEAFAVTAALWFFERFNWLHVTEADLSKIQSQYLAQC